MENVCLTCGDRGISEALIFCNKCKAYSVHLYCLPEIPDDSDIFFWLCEDCESETRNLSSLDKCNPDSESLGSVQEKKDSSASKLTRKSNINGSTGSLKRPKDPGLQKSPSLQLDSEKNSHNPEYERHNRLDDKCSMNETVESELDGKGINVSEIGCSKDSENLKLVITHSPETVEKNYVPSQPIEQPIWKGHLMSSDDLLDGMLGLTAHLSNLACPRVREEAKSLPLLLSSELLPRSALWPKSFTKWGPGGDSIALYFFPDSESSERVFDGLVNGMIERDLGMRAVVQNAELLIFTSRLMPMDYWRFQAKYYLWGVFKGKKSRSPAGIAVVGGVKGVQVLGGRSSVSPLGSGSNGFGSPFSSLTQSMP